MLLISSVALENGEFALFSVTFRMRESWYIDEGGSLAWYTLTILLGTNGCLFIWGLKPILDLITLFEIKLFLFIASWDLSLLRLSQISWTLVLLIKLLLTEPALSLVWDFIIFSDFFCSTETLCAWSKMSVAVCGLDVTCRLVTSSRSLFWESDFLSNYVSISFLFDYTGKGGGWIVSGSGVIRNFVLLMQSFLVIPKP